MNIDVAAWLPQPGERVLLAGMGARSDFLSAQTVTATGGDSLSTTGAWRFERRGGGWHAKVDDRITLRPQPQLNADIGYPALTG